MRWLSSTQAVVIGEKVQRLRLDSVLDHCRLMLPYRSKRISYDDMIAPWRGSFPYSTMAAWYSFIDSCLGSKILQLKIAPQMTEKLTQLSSP